MSDTKLFDLSVEDVADAMSYKSYNDMVVLTRNQYQIREWDPVDDGGLPKHIVDMVTDEIGECMVQCARCGEAMWSDEGHECSGIYQRQPKKATNKAYCVGCDKVIPKKQLLTHTNRHRKENGHGPLDSVMRKLQCSICGETVQWGNMARHKKRVHSEYKCQYCKEIFSGNEIHEHRKKCSNYCPKCGATDINKSRNRSKHLKRCKGPE